MDFLKVKLHEKTIYAKILPARAAVFDLRGVKGQGQKYFGLKKDFFSCKIARENDLR